VSSKNASIALLAPGRQTWKAHPGGDHPLLAQSLERLVGLQGEARVAEVVEPQVADAGLHAERPQLVAVGRGTRLVGVVVLGLLERALGPVRLDEVRVRGEDPQGQEADPGDAVAGLAVGQRRDVGADLLPAEAHGLSGGLERHAADQQHVAGHPACGG